MTGIDPEMIQAADELSASLAELFRRGGWSHHRLAGEAGLSPATVLAIVNGSTGIPRSGTLTAFVRACGQDPAPWIAARGRAVQAAKAHGPGKFPEVRLVPWRTGVFVGRGEELARLDRALGRRGGVVVHVIHGLGGIGKSALAAEYARTRADRYDLVWWCSADSAAQVEAGLAVLAGALWPGAGHGAAGELAERALQWLASQDRWLLVLDNVTSLADVRPLLARAWSGRLLLTSRLGTGWHQVTSSVTRLEVLPEGEASGLLAQIAVVGRPDAVLDGIGELCTWLGCLPLAIEQAAGYLQQNSLSPREYLALLAGHPAAMFDQMPQGSDPQRTIARIWRVTLDRLADVPLACHLLRVLAWWAPRPIPRSLPGALADPSAIQPALGALAAYNMITLEPEAIAVHRLVQAVARTPDPGDPHRQEADISYARGHAAGLLAQAAPESPQDPGGWSAWRSLLPHIDSLVTHASPETDTFVTCGLLSQATAFLLRQRTESQAISYAQRTLDGARRLYGPDHPDTLVASNQLAHARKAAGDLSAAITLYEQVLASHRRILGPGHPETLMCSNNLARAYRAAGDLERAIPLFEQTAVACDRILGASHPRRSRFSLTSPTPTKQQVTSSRPSRCTTGPSPTASGSWVPTIPTRSCPASAWPAPTRRSATRSGPSRYTSRRSPTWNASLDPTIPIPSPLVSTSLTPARRRVTRSGPSPCTSRPSPACGRHPALTTPSLSSLRATSPAPTRRLVTWPRLSRCSRKPSPARNAS